MIKKFCGQFERVKCSDCRVEFPIFIFSGDTDMATDGFRSAVDIKIKKIFICTRDKYDEVFNTADCTEPELISVDELRRHRRESFQQFLRRSAGTAVYRYKCPVCGGCNAISQKTLSKSEVLDMGYDVVERVTCY